MNALEHVWFIGGSPCAGKSTVCDLLAQRHGFQAYHCDDHWDAHLERATEHQPTLTGFRGRPLIELMTRPLEVMIDDALEANRELGALALEDVRAMQGPVVAEGMPFMPDVLTRLKPPVQAVYLVPSAAFQREHYAKREGALQLATQAPDPALMFEHWMQRNIANGQTVAELAQAHGFPVLEVDGFRSILETVYWCETRLGLVSP